jgi:hypothetical protein
MYAHYMFRAALGIAHHTTGGTTRRHRPHGRIDEGISPNIRLMDESTEVSSGILDTSEDVQCWSKKVV